MDLGEAAERGITVAEITGSNTVSVAEHAAMQILALVRNFIPAYRDIVEGGWSIGEIAYAPTTSKARPWASTARARSDSSSLPA